MRDAFVITPIDCTFQLLAETASSAGYRYASREREAIWSEGNGAQVILTEDPAIERLLDEQEREAVQACGPERRYYHIQYRDRAGAERVIVELFQSVDGAIVDNDHGLLISVDLFAATIAKCPTWDWTAAGGLPRSTRVIRTGEDDPDRRE